MTIEQLVNLCKSLSSDRKKSHSAASKFGVRTGDADVLRRLLGMTDKELKKRKLSDNDRPFIISYLHENPMTSLKFFAEKFNVSTSAIFYFLKSKGYSSEISSERKWSVFKKRKLEYLVMQGLKDREVAERMGLSEGCVSQARNRILGISKNRGRKSNAC